MCCCTIRLIFCRIHQCVERPNTFECTHKRQRIAYECTPCTMHRLNTCIMHHLVCSSECRVGRRCLFIDKTNRKDREQWQWRRRFHARFRYMLVIVATFALFLPRTYEQVTEWDSHLASLDSIWNYSNAPFHGSNSNASDECSDCRNEICSQFRAQSWRREHVLVSCILLDIRRPRMSSSSRCKRISLEIKKVKRNNGDVNLCYPSTFDIRLAYTTVECVLGSVELQQ